MQIDYTDYPETTELSREFRSDICKVIKSRLGFPYSRRGLQLLHEAENFRDCGQKKTVFSCPKDGHNYGIATTCKSRFCPVCGRRMSKKYYRVINDSLKTIAPVGRVGWTTALLTLTMKKRSGLAAAEFQEAWRRVSDFLRYHYGKRKAKIGRNGRVVMLKAWKGAGAIAVPEVGPSGNLHFHCIVYGPVYPQKILSANWRAFTGDSFIVDIRKIRGKRRSVAGYVTKYILKPVAGQSPEFWADLFTMLKGSRRIKCIGIFYGLKFKNPYRAQKKRCIYCGAELKFRGVHGDSAHKLIDWLSMKKYCDFDNDVYVRLPYARTGDLTFFEDMYHGQNL